MSKNMIKSLQLNNEKFLNKKYNNLLEIIIFNNNNNNTKNYVKLIFQL